MSINSLDDFYSLTERNKQLSQELQVSQVCINLCINFFEELTEL